MISVTTYEVRLCGGVPPAPIRPSSGGSRLGSRLRHWSHAPAARFAWLVAALVLQGLYSRISVGDAGSQVGIPGVWYGVEWAE